MYCETFDVECSSATCLNGGSCVPLEGNYTCNCVEGFNGAHCEHNINDCLNNPCRNGGTCYDGVNDYNCNCTNLFMGKNCDEPYDACIKNRGQCKNGGQCKKLVTTSGSTHNEAGVPTDFYCECQFGFSGVFCQTNDDDCLNAQCAPGKICVDGIGTHDCQDVANCDLNPCQNNGTCSDSVNGYR